MKLPVVSGKELVKILFRHGYTVHDQKGSHVHMRHPTKTPLTVPCTANWIEDFYSLS